jgi:hypothetical protein
MLGGVFSRVMFEQYRKISWYIGTTTYNIQRRWGKSDEATYGYGIFTEPMGEKKETNQNPTPDLPIDM